MPPSESFRQRDFRVTSLSFTNFRSLKDVNDIPLGRLTILVGENSTGKTAFLAGLRAALDALRGDDRYNVFNRPPFVLGSYSDIVHYRSERGRRSSNFSIALSFINDRVALTFRKYEELAQLNKISLSTPDGNVLEICFVPLRRPKSQIKKLPNGFRVVMPEEALQSLNLSRFLLFRDLRHSRRSARTSKSTNYSSENISLSEQDGEKFLSLAERLFRLLFQSSQMDIYPMAPIRSHPQRLYEPSAEIPSPEGSHIPLLLARRSDELNRLLDIIQKFSGRAGLFDDIEVHRLASRGFSPFELLVKVHGVRRNIADVGYGVSQALPILVQIGLAQRKRSIFLIQQPEVHLHPRAQAEIGSFFVWNMVEGNSQFLVETHSDYLIDRIRIEARKLSEEKRRDIVILFFKIDNGKTRITPMQIGKDGELENEPAEYREFFIREAEKLLGID